MSQPAAIDVQIVDIKNDPQHKGSIRITAHVPVERGAELTAVIVAGGGWPTYTNPVPAALAVLDMNAGGSVPTSAREVGSKPQGAMVTMAPTSRSLSQKIGWLCTIIRFQKFLQHALPEEWQKAVSRVLCDTPTYGTDLKYAAQVVRDWCNVESRAEITPETPAAARWYELEFSYEAWLREPQVVG